MSTDAPTSFRLSETARQLLAELAEQLGISQAAVLEILIRDKAKAEKITLKSPSQQRPRPRAI
jgi:PIN domain nuclease of toxin-antitoxin system